MLWLVKVMLFSHVIVSSIPTFKSEQVEGCKICDCYNSTVAELQNQPLLIAECSNRGLHHIPTDLPKTTDFLILCNNEISDFSHELLTFDNLKGLDISANNIVELSEKAFAGVPNLEYVRLENNQLNFIDEKTFLHVPKLQTVVGMHLRNVSGGFFSEIPELHSLDLTIDDSQLSENIFKNTGLKKVALHVPHVAALPNGLFHSNIKSLSEILISGNTPSFGNEIFSELSQLKKIHIKVRNISDLPKHIFHGLHDKVDSEILAVLNMMGLSSDQYVKQFKTFQINKMKLSENLPKTIQLTEISLEGVSNIDEHIFQFLLNLETIKIRHAVRINGNPFRSLHRLDYLELHMKNMNSINPEWFTDLGALKVLNISRCHLTHINPSDFANLGSLQTLDLSHNYILALDKDIFKTFSSSIKTIDLSYNKLTHLPDELFTKIFTLKAIYLQHNDIEDFSSSLFLRKDENKFTSVFLNVLDLRHNNLHDFDIDVLKIGYIKRFLLKNNLISSIETIKPIKLNVEVIDLFENPINCSCEFLTFLTFAKNYSMHFRLKNEIQMEGLCSSPARFNNMSLVDAAELNMCYSTNFEAYANFFAQPTVPPVTMHMNMNQPSGKTSDQFMEMIEFPTQITPVVEERVVSKIQIEPAVTLYPTQSSTTKSMNFTSEEILKASKNPSILTDENKLTISKISTTQSSTNETFLLNKSENEHFEINTPYNNFSKVFSPSTAEKDLVKSQGNLSLLKDKSIHNFITTMVVTVQEDDVKSSTSKLTTLSPSILSHSEMENIEKEFEKVDKILANKFSLYEAGKKATEIVNSKTAENKNKKEKLRNQENNHLKSYTTISTTLNSTLPNRRVKGSPLELSLLTNRSIKLASNSSKNTFKQKMNKKLTIENLSVLKEVSMDGNVHPFNNTFTPIHKNEEKTLTSNVATTLSPSAISQSDLQNADNEFAQEKENSTSSQLFSKIMKSKFAPLHVNDKFQRNSNPSKILDFSVSRRTEIVSDDSTANTTVQNAVKGSGGEQLQFKRVLSQIAHAYWLKKPGKVKPIKPTINGRIQANVGESKSPKNIFRKAISSTHLKIVNSVQKLSKHLNTEEGKSIIKSNKNLGMTANETKWNESDKHTKGKYLDTNLKKESGLNKSNFVPLDHNNTLRLVYSELKVKVGKQIGRKEIARDDERKYILPTMFASLGLIAIVFAIIVIYKLRGILYKRNYAVK